MAATLTQERFSGPEWSFERKYDGIRLLAFRRGQAVRLLSRNRLKQHHPAIEAAIRALPVREVILDGEVDWNGAAYHVFDILWLDQRDLTPLPLEERRARLAVLPLVQPLARAQKLRLIQRKADGKPNQLRPELFDGALDRLRGQPAAE